MARLPKLTRGQNKNATLRTGSSQPAWKVDRRLIVNDNYWSFLLSTRGDDA